MGNGRGGINSYSERMNENNKTNNIIPYQNQIRTINNDKNLLNEDRVY